jgi:long-chain acyl-CoA synthetase
VALQYFGSSEKNTDTFTADGWLKTGDIAQIMSGHNSVKIIDRKKNIFKLCQGEYIVPEKLETGYK